MATLGFQEEFAAIAAEKAAADAEARKAGLPFAFDPDDFLGIKARERKYERLILAAIQEFAGTGSMTFEEFTALTVLTGRIYGPSALFVLDRFAALHPGAYAPALPYAWSLAEFPALSLARSDWRRLWRRAGFTEDGKPAKRPTEPVRLWRGATRGHKGAFSWTCQRERAEWFVKARSGAGREVLLWTVLAPPEALLARIHEGGRGEFEWVTDTRGLKIEEVTE